LDSQFYIHEKVDQHSLHKMAVCTKWCYGPPAQIIANPCDKITFIGVLNIISLSCYLHMFFLA